MRLYFAICLSLFQISNEKHLNNEEREIQNAVEVSYSGNLNLKRHNLWLIYIMFFYIILIIVKVTQSNADRFEMF